VQDEKILWIEVLLRAISDAVGRIRFDGSNNPAGIQRSARAWFFSSDYNIGSFLWISDLLGLDSSAVRKRITELAKPQISPVVQVLRPPVMPAIKEEGNRVKAQRSRLLRRWVKLPCVPQSLAPGPAGGRDNLTLT